MQGQNSNITGMLIRDVPFDDAFSMQHLHATFIIPTALICNLLSQSH